MTFNAPLLVEYLYVSALLLRIELIGELSGIGRSFALPLYRDMAGTDSDSCPSEESLMLADLSRVIEKALDLMVYPALFGRMSAWTIVAQRKRMTKQ